MGTSDDIRRLNSNTRETTPCHGKRHERNYREVNYLAGKMKVLDV